MTKHIVCYSGGHSSALVAIEVYRRYGPGDLILLNHDINPRVEDEDVKRFKTEIAQYIGVPITYANHPDWETKDQFDVVVEAKAFKVGNGTALCTNRLKTAPFEKYLDEHFRQTDCVIYYGFDAKEKRRILRRSSYLAALGYRTDFPLATWARTIQSTEEIGIKPPLTYGVFKHANCVGCLKAGQQHWYVVFCTRPDIWEKAKRAEDVIGYSIIKDHYLDELEPKFEVMRKAGVQPTEHINSRRFWIEVKKIIGSEPEENDNTDEKPCDCVA